MVRRLIKRRKARELNSLADVAYRRGLASNGLAAGRARDVLSGEVTSTEQNLAHPYFRDRVPSKLRPHLLRFARQVAVSETRSWQLNLMLQSHHIAARQKFGVAIDRPAHLVYSLNDIPDAGVTCEVDQSFLVRYPDRLYQFVEFFALLTFHDFFRFGDLAALENQGIRVTPDIIRAALVRYALMQENLTDGGACLVPKEATKLRYLYTPGAMAGYTAHSFILAHELAHRLVDEADTAPQLSNWLEGNSLSHPRSETTADAIAVMLMASKYADQTVETEGSRLALSALSALDVGSHARLPTLGVEITDRLKLVRPFCRVSNSPRINPARTEFLRRVAYYEGAVPSQGWDALHYLVKRGRIAAIGHVHEAIELTRFGDLPLAIGKRDIDLRLLRKQVNAAPAIFHSLVGSIDSLTLHASDGIGSYTLRFCDLLGIKGAGREVMEDLASPVRMYDLIAWLFDSPALAPLIEINREEGYATAIYLAGVYAGSCARAMERQL
ncbi:hypothetical protein QCN29_07225 [Streptomyces sp. HNM0663]|uniref:Uncharacterized protein n=1 Tax=Streptomyces chengmaiensis TaxID=3040919 RepID=A0ABT6HK02_9ACTN|nr:hypothetical protein [Streptomyces chengmaiensis]MDH2388578.1 hypothetical protein [Streptomyces chengmaiensis]